MSRKVNKKAIPVDPTFKAVERQRKKRWADLPRLISMPNPHAGKKLDFTVAMQHMDKINHLFAELSKNSDAEKHIGTFVDFGCAYLRIEFEMTDWARKQNFMQEILREVRRNFDPNSEWSLRYQEDYMNEPICYGDPEHSARQLAMQFTLWLSKAENKADFIQVRWNAFMAASVFAGQMKYACKYFESLDKDDNGNIISQQAAAARKKHENDTNAKYEVIRDVLNQLEGDEQQSLEKLNKKSELARKIAKAVLTRLQEKGRYTEYSLLNAEVIARADEKTREKNSTLKPLDDFVDILANFFSKSPYKEIVGEFFEKNFPNRKR